MTDLTPTQHNVLKILLADTSSRKPITGLQISKRTGFVSGRPMKGGEMRAIIHALRVKNFPICATGRGYFYARTDDELSKFIMKLQSRVISQEEALNGLKESFHNVGGIHEKEKQVTVRRIVRTPQGTAAYMNFAVDALGKPIVPEGVELL